VFPVAENQPNLFATTTGRDGKVRAVAALAITPTHLSAPADLPAIIRGHWGQESASPHP
jgi:hypothetical protein